MIRRFLTLENLAAFHAGLLLAFATWALGGSAAWAQTALALLGSFGIFLTAAAIRERLLSQRDSLAALHWLWPLGGLNILVLLSALHPTFRTAVIEGAEVLIPIPVSPRLPASANPTASIEQLWLLDVLYLSCFNLVLAVRRRRTLRVLLLLMTANALVLAIFGSLQKLTHASGLFFGQIESPNVTFFASFIYHNHWGAFVVLMVATSLGLVFFAVRRPGYRDFWHSPAFAGLVAILFLAATAPLSGSRSCTLLILLLLLFAFFQAVRQIASRGGKGARGTLLSLVLAIGLGGAGIYVLARPIIRSRLDDTRAQLSQIHESKTLDTRAQLYRDTWTLAHDRLWLGWGLGGYARVFMLYNTQQSVDRLPQYYEDAHSDWLQSIAEVGVIGAGLHALLFVLPFFRCLRGLGRDLLPTYLFLGCGGIILYALVEFPFGNPAVSMAFWLCFFCAVRLTQLNEREVPA